MALEEVILPKTYKDGKVLFAKDLDNVRLKAEEGFANVNLNLTQLIKDIFSAGYTYDNDGNANKDISLEDRINAFEQGGAVIGGTASDTFTINTDGNGATLSTSGLTNTHTYTFPDVSGEILTTTGVQTITGAKTFSLQSLKIKGAGAGSIILDYANDTDSRTYTFPDAGANAEVLLSAGQQTITGVKIIPDIDAPVANGLYSPGTAKAWGGATTQTYNVSSYVKTGTGVFEATLITSLQNNPAADGVITTSVSQGSGAFRYIEAQIDDQDTLTFNTFNSAYVAADANVKFCLVGVQI